MKNTQIYARTLKFSFLRIGVSILGLLLGVLITLAGYWFTRANPDTCPIVTTICGILGIIVFCLFSRYVGYMFKAGQIAMIAKGVTEGTLPEDVVSAGKEMVKQRFVTVNVYFAIQRVIAAITNQLTHGINAASRALGGLTGSKEGGNIAGGIGSAISAFVSIVLEYVNYCCLGWVFVHPEENAFKSTCDGAVIYFQNWKTLLKNAGKIFGLTLVSLLVIGVVLFGALNVVVPANFGLSEQNIAQMDITWTNDETGEETKLTPEEVRLVGIAVLALLCWGIVHAALVKPYILVSAMRTYMDAAQKTTPSVDIYDKLCGLSKGFKKAYQQAV